MFSDHCYSLVRSRNAPLLYADFYPVTPRTMNYASVVFAGFFAIATAWYFVWGKKNYEGPPTHEDVVIEARMASMANTRGK